MPEWLQVVLPVLGLIGSVAIALFAVGRGVGMMQEGQRRFEEALERRLERIEKDLTERVSLPQFLDRWVWADERYGRLTSDLGRLRERIHDIAETMHDFTLHASQEHRAPAWLKDVLERIEERARQREVEEAKP